MSAPLVFIDTETTGLHRDRRTWEVGAIRCEPDGSTRELHQFVQADDLLLPYADAYGLQVGKFYARHPQFAGGRVTDGSNAGSEWEVARDVEWITRGAVLVASNPTFDHIGLADMLARQGLVPSWHYRPIDVATLMAGWLRGHVNALDGLGDRYPEPPERQGDAAQWRAQALDALRPPWSSERLAAACGVPAATDDERHTAVGDARWVQRCWALVMGQA